MLIFMDKPVGHSETLEETIDGKQFLIHCTKSDKIVTKIMSTHGVLAAVEDHETIQRVMVNGQTQIICFKYL